MKRLYVCSALAVLVGVLAVEAQSPPPPAFEVASVRRNNAALGGSQIRNAAGNFSATNVALPVLIRLAYQIQEFQIAGMPDWARAARFDVEGRFDPAVPTPGFDTPPQKTFAMLKTLLRDRFQLAAHMETREMPVFALRLARPDGTPGPQLKRSSVDCAALAPGRGRGPIDGRGGSPPEGRLTGPPPDGRFGGPPPGTIPAGERPICGGRGGFGQLLIGGMPISQLATQLAQMTNRVVIDRTGLTGAFDIELKWSPTPDQLPAGPPPPGVEPPPIDPNGPSLFAALQEQLGLKLESERDPVDVLVIDRLEPPREN